MQSAEERPVRGRCCRITWCVIWVVISLLVIVTAIAVTVGLATLGSGYSIAAAAVFNCLPILFILVPAIGSGVVCCYIEGRYEAAAVFTAVMCSLAIVFALVPFFHVIAAGLAIAETTVGKNADDASVLSLGVLATVLNVVAAVASIFVCTTICIYLWRRRPVRATDKKKLVVEKKLSETR